MGVGTRPPCHPSKSLSILVLKTAARRPLHGRPRKEVAMQETVIATIEKNAVEEVRVALSEYRGHDLVNLRIWANYDSAGSEKRPTKKGFALRIERLPELIAVLKKAEAEARAAGLLGAKPPDG